MLLFDAFVKDAYNQYMAFKSKTQYNKRLPILVEKGLDGFYIVQCPILEGCYTQGRTIDEALKNIREVISLLLEEKNAREILKNYDSEEVSLHTITV